MGTAYLTIALRHPAAGACTIRGYPTVRALDRGRAAAVDVRRRLQGLDGLGPHLVTVTSARPAVVIVEWTVGHSCPPRTVDSLELSLPESTTSFRVRGFGGSTCNPGEGAAPIEVQPIQASRSAALRGTARREATVRARRLIQAFLDAWAEDGYATALHRYLTREFRVVDDSGMPRLVSGRVTRATLHSWTSNGRFTVEVDLDLHFRGDPMAWTNGVNTRFVTVEAGRRLTFATSP
jgi:hypothetical protein